MSYPISSSQLSKQYFSKETSRKHEYKNKRIQSISPEMCKTALANLATYIPSLETSPSAEKLNATKKNLHLLYSSPIPVFTNVSIKNSIAELNEYNSRINITKLFLKKNAESVENNVLKFPPETFSVLEARLKELQYIISHKSLNLLMHFFPEPSHEETVSLILLLKENSPGLSFETDPELLRTWKTFLQQLIISHPKLKKSINTVLDEIEKNLSSTSIFKEDSFNQLEDVQRELLKSTRADLRFEGGQFSVILRNKVRSFFEKLFRIIGRSSASHKAAQALLAHIKLGMTIKSFFKTNFLPFCSNEWFKGVLRHHQDLLLDYTRLFLEMAKPTINSPIITFNEYINKEQLLSEIQKVLSTLTPEAQKDITDLCKQSLKKDTAYLKAIIQEEISYFSQCLKNEEFTSNQNALTNAISTLEKINAKITKTDPQKKIITTLIERILTQLNSVPKKKSSSH
jgi:hypothetical protein